MATVWLYKNFLSVVANGSFEWENDTIKCALVKDTYMTDYNLDTDEVWGDISSHEVSGSGYSQVTVSGKTATINLGGGFLTLDCDSPTWLALTCSDLRGAVFYRDSTVDSLICWVDIGMTIDPANQSFVLNTPSTGLLTFLAY